MNYRYDILKFRTTVIQGTVSLHQVVYMVTYSDLFTFAIMIIALLAYLKQDDKDNEWN